MQDIQESAGHGVSALVDGKKVLAGNAAYLQEAGLEPLVPRQTGTAVHVAVDGVYAGYLLIADAVKPDSAEAVRELRRSGIDCLAMLTGDSESTAKAVGEALQLDEVHAKCLPADKVSYMQQYREKLSSGRTLVFVGDGMNDAPVLAQSDVGVAWAVLARTQRLPLPIWSFWTISLRSWRLPCELPGRPCVWHGKTLCSPWA